MNISTEEELKSMIWEKYGNFELSHIKNESIVESILEFVLKQRVEFAKLHVKTALEAAAKETKCIPVEGITDDFQVDKDSILNAYDLNLIQ